jgi:general secretion pathway protein G
MTLIEIMVVIAILGLMAAAVGYSALGNFIHARHENARLDCKQLEGALEMYFSRYSKYPDAPEGLNALVRTHIIKTLPPDPWGRPYMLEVSPDGPVVISYGEDGKPGGSGANADISSRDPALGQ